MSPLPPPSAEGGQIPGPARLREDLRAIACRSTRGAAGTLTAAVLALYRAEALLTWTARGPSLLASISNETRCASEEILEVERALHDAAMEVVLLAVLRSDVSVALSG